MTEFITQTNFVIKMIFKFQTIKKQKPHEKNKFNFIFYAELFTANI